MPLPKIIEDKIPYILSEYLESIYKLNSESKSAINKSIYNSDNLTNETLNLNSYKTDFLSKKQLKDKDSMPIQKNITVLCGKNYTPR